MSSYKTNTSLPGDAVEPRKTYKRKGNYKFKKGPYKKRNKDQVQDREIAKLKKLIKDVAPPVKSTYSEFVLNPQNEWIAFGLPYPSLGGDPTERLGAQIKLRSINLRFNLAVSETDNFDTMRVILVQYMNGNEHDEFPLNYNTDLWLSPTTDYPILSPYNTQSASTYRVLYDEVFNLNENGKAQCAKNLVLYSKDLAIYEIKFDTDAGGALAGLDRGLIVGYACSDSSASPNPSITGTFKLNFVDS